MENITICKEFKKMLNSIANSVIKNANNSYLINLMETGNNISIIEVKSYENLGTVISISDNESNEIKSTIRAQYFNKNNKRIIIWSIANQLFELLLDIDRDNSKKLRELLREVDVIKKELLILNK